MSNLILESIYSKQNEKIPSYLDVIFKTNFGFFEVGHGILSPIAKSELIKYEEDLLDEIKNEFGILSIQEARVDYDSSMYFLIANRFLLVLGYVPDTYSDLSNQLFWIERDIYLSNKDELNNFLEMKKIALPS